MEQEIWKDVPNYEGYYQISNIGTLKGLNRTILNALGRKYYIKEQLIAANLDRYGYLKTCLSKYGERKSTTIHRLVALAFIPNPDNHPCVNHIDGNKLNNNSNNLEWCSVLHNNIHALTTGLKIMPGGESVSSSKLKDVDIISIRNSYANKIKKQKELAKEYNVSISTISMIINRIIWKHI